MCEDYEGGEIRYQLKCTEDENFTREFLTSRIFDVKVRDISLIENVITDTTIKVPVGSDYYTGICCTEAFETNDYVLIKNAIVNVGMHTVLATPVIVWGDWVQYTIYTIGDVRVYDGVAYLLYAFQENTAPTPPEAPSYWKVLPAAFFIIDKFFNVAETFVSNAKVYNITQTYNEEDWNAEVVKAYHFKIQAKDDASPNNYTQFSEELTPVAPENWAADVWEESLSD